jgi:WD40 repeat protein
LVSQSNLTEKEIEELVKTAVENYLEKVYREIGRPTKKFIEKKLITSDGAKNSVNYNEVKDDPDLKHDIDELITNQDFRLLSKGQFLDSEHISILHDRLLPPLLKRRRKREAHEKRTVLMRVISIAAGVCVLIGLWFYNKNSTRNRILKAFAYSQLAGQEISNDPTVALRIAQMAYQKDSNKLITDAFKKTALENALYKTIINGDSSHIFISCAASSTGDSVVTGCANGKVTLWRKGSQQVREYKGSEAEVNSIAFSQDGKTILAGSTDGHARLYNVNDSNAIKSFPSGILAVSLSRDGKRVLTGSSDNYIYLWNSNGSLIDTFRYNEGRGLFYGVTSMSFSPDGKMFAAGLSNNDAVVWQLDQKSKRPLTISTHGNNISSLAFSADGSKLAIGSAPGIITLCYLDGPPSASLNDTKTKVRNGLDFQIYGADDIRSIAFVEDGTKILTASTDHMVRLTDLNGNLVKMLKGHTGPVLYAQFSGKKIISCSADATVRLWTIPEIEDHKMDFFDYDHPIISAALSPDGNLMLTGSSNGFAELWDVKTGKIRMTLTAAPESYYDYGDVKCFISSVSFSPDGTKILTTNCRGAAYLWPISGNTGYALPGQIYDKVATAVFSPDGKKILTISLTKEIKVWSVSDLSNPSLTYNNDKSIGVLSAVFGPNSDEILAAYDDGIARLWTTEAKPRKLAEFKSDRTSKMFCVAISPDGKRIITGSEDRKARVWDRDGNLKKTLVGHNGIVTSVAIASATDTVRIVTGSDDGSVMLWELPNGLHDEDSLLAPVKKLYLGVPAQVNSVSFLNGGKIILSTSGNLARLWNTRLSIYESQINGDRLDAFIDQFNDLTNSQKKEFKNRIRDSYK